MRLTSNLNSSYKAPTVSVVVPLYNKARTIVRTLESVRRQSFTDFECIVVDDGSTDDGALLAAGITDPRFRVVSQRNAGEGAARNRGIREARGSLIAFLDSDDEWDPAFLEAVVSLSHAYPEAGLLATGFRRCYGIPPDKETTLLFDTQAHTTLIEDYFRLARQGDFVTSSTVAIRRSVFDAAGLFLEGERLGADRELWSRIALDYSFAYDCRILATYYIEQGGIAHYLAGANPPFPPVVRTLRKVLLQRPLDPHLKQEIEAYCDQRLLAYARQLLFKRSQLLAGLLKTESFFTKRAAFEAGMLRVAISILPIRVVSTLWGRCARYAAGLRRSIRPPGQTKQRPAVLTRIVRTRCIPQAQKITAQI